jgi:hypothetical protein
MPNDGLVWVLVGAAFCLGVACTLAAQRFLGRQPRSGPTERIAVEASATPAPGGELVAAPNAFPTDSMPLPTDPAGATGTIRSLLLQITAERIPVGWTALLVCPPDRTLPAAWHVHLASTVVLAIPDGRTMPIPMPRPVRRWSLPGGRTVSVAEGGAERPITHESVSVQVSGPYLKVALANDAEGHLRLQASTFADPRGTSEIQTVASGSAEIVGALRQAVDLAVSGRMTGMPPTVGYSRAAWEAHERIWLDVHAD